MIDRISAHARVVSLIFICLFWAPALVLGQAVELKWKFEAGQAFGIQLNQETTLLTEFDLARQQVETTASMQCAWTVVDVAKNGDAQIDMTIDAVKLALTISKAGDQPGQMVATSQIEVDTGNAAATDAATDGREAEKAILANLRAILGEKIRMEVTSRGQIGDIRLTDKMKDAIRSAPQAMQMKALFGESALQELFGQTSPALPESAVEPGATWSTTSQFGNSLGRFQRQLDFTYRGPQPLGERTADRIDFVAKLSLVPPDNPKETVADKGKSIEIVSQNTSGTVWFDSADGRLLESTINSAIETNTPYRDDAINVKLTSKNEAKVEKQ